MIQQPNYYLFFYLWLKQGRVRTFGFLLLSCTNLGCPYTKLWGTRSYLANVCGRQSFSSLDPLSARSRDPAGKLEQGLTANKLRVPQSGFWQGQNWTASLARIQMDSLFQINMENCFSLLSLKKGTGWHYTASLKRKMRLNSQQKKEQKYALF